MQNPYAVEKCNLKMKIVVWEKCTLNPIMERFIKKGKCENDNVETPINFVHFFLCVGRMVRLSSSIFTWN